MHSQFPLLNPWEGARPLDLPSVSLPPAARRNASYFDSRIIDSRLLFLLVNHRICSYLDDQNRVQGWELAPCHDYYNTAIGLTEHLVLKTNIHIPRLANQTPNCGMNPNTDPILMHFGYCYGLHHCFDFGKDPLCTSNEDPMMHKVKNEL